MPRLYDVALVLRSKNAGPFTLTIDVILPSLECAEKVYSALTPEAVAELYRVGVEDVLGIILVRELRAVKVNIARRVPAGEPGDADVYGAQQHVPLGLLEVDECGQD